MYKKDQQLETALEARRFMVAHPGCEIECRKGYLYRLNPESYTFQYYSKLQSRWLVDLVDKGAPFTIIDEPADTERLDLQTGEMRPVKKPLFPEGSIVFTDEVETESGLTLKGFQVTTPKQPEWVRVHIGLFFHPAPDTFEPKYPRLALQHICQHAQQVRITWPEWECGDNYNPVICVDPTLRANRQDILYAFQVIGATVEYLPRVSEQPKEGL